VEIKRSGSQPSGKGPAAYFTGTVRIDPLNSLKSRLKRGFGGRGALWATPEISFPGSSSGRVPSGCRRWSHRIGMT
jgi:hypothetical protein